MHTGQHILVVDDDQDIGRLLTELLGRYDYNVELASSAASARQKLSARSFDLVILDVLMPGENGTDLCRQIRSRSAMPIIMLTAASDLTDRVVGLEMGADDYMLKPFEGRELVARVRTVLRRASEARPQEAKVRASLRFGEWRLDLAKRELRSAGGVLVLLSNAEFQVLRSLAQRPNTVMSREWLAEASFGSVHCQGSRNVDVLISRLRLKMGPHDTSAPLIETVRSGGYALRGSVD